MNDDTHFNTYILSSKKRLMNRIIIADDHPIFIEGLKETISSWDDYQLVACASNGYELIQLCSENKADIIVLDYKMPNLNGIDAIIHIKKISNAKLVVMSFSLDECVINQAKDNGAHGFINKSVDMKTLYRKLNEILEGKIIFPTEEDIFNIYYAPLKTKFGLSRQETYLIKDINEGLSIEEISNKRFISIETVKSHKKRIFYKLDIKKISELLFFLKKNIIS